MPEGDREPDREPGEVSVRTDADGRACELVLVKRDQRYVFRCAPGEEASLLDQLTELVRDPASDLTWFDAAVLSHQVGRRLGDRMGRESREQ